MKTVTTYLSFDGNWRPIHLQADRSGLTTISPFPSIAMDEAERIFTALSQAGQVRMPLGKMHWGE